MNELFMAREGLGKGYHIYREKIWDVTCLKSLSLKIIYVLSGSIVYEVREESLEIGSKEVLIINRGEQDFIYGKDAEILVLDISDDYLKSYKELYFYTLYSNYIEEGKIEEKFKVYLNELLKDKKIEGNNKNLYLDKSLDIVFNLYRNIDYHIAHSEEKLEIIKEINKHLSMEKIKTVDLKTLEEELFVTQQYISGVFKEIRGISYSKYLQHLKLYYGILYLLNTSNSVEEISYRLGFSSSKSLNRIFNNYLNITPYRYKLLNEGRRNLNKNFLNIENIKEGTCDVEAYARVKYCKIDFKTVDEIHISKRIKDNFKTIFNIEELGSNLEESLINIDRFEIQKIVLKLSYDKGGYRLEGVNRSMSMTELQDILLLCIENKIEIFLGVYMEDIREDLSNIEEILDKYREFYLGLAAIGLSNVRSINFMMNLEHILEFTNSQLRFDAYLRLIEGHKKIFLDIIKAESFKIGVDLGDIYEEDMKKYISLYKSLKLDLVEMDYKFLMLGYKSRKKISIESLNNSREYSLYIEKKLNELYKIVKDTKYNISELYVSSIFEYFDISTMNSRYKDIFIAGIILDNLIHIDRIKENFNFILDFVMYNEKEPNNREIPKFINEIDTKTPLYWLVSVVSNIYGHAIYKSRGILGLKDGENANIVIYGDMIEDNHIVNNMEINLEAIKENYEFSISGLNGLYKLVTIKISGENGNIINNIVDYKNFKYLNYREKEFVNRSAFPNISINIVKIDNIYSETLIRDPFSIIFKKFIKL